MLMLRAYFDDSGHSQDPNDTVVCIGGCVSPVSAWEQLQPEWKRVLEDFKVPYLHMKEFAHSEGVFAEGWKGDEPKRTAFLGALMDTMDRHVMSVVSTTVLISDFNRLTAVQRQQMVDPHFMCLQDVFLASTITLHDKPNEQVDIVFSNQSRHVGLTERFLESAREEMSLGGRLGAFTWASPQSILPLQAADLVAYETRRFAKDLFLDQASTMRTPMKRLFRMMPFFHFFDKNEITKRFYFNGLGTFHVSS